MRRSNKFLSRFSDRFVVSFWHALPADGSIDAMKKLFEDRDDSRDAEPGGRIVGIAVAVGVWGLYDYRWPASLGEPFKGQRVFVPFGAGDRKTPGFVVERDRPPPEGIRLKTVSAVVDGTLQTSLAVFALAEWMADYYMTPLGFVLQTCIPSVAGHHADRRETCVYLAEGGEPDARMGSRQKQLLDELVEAKRQGIEPVQLSVLLKKCGADRKSFQGLVTRGLVRTEMRAVQLESLADGTRAASDPFELNAEQAAVVASLREKIDAGGYGATLLHGVTGSGKTEIYVRLIRRVVAQGRSVILLTPEIALATQTFRRLLARLGRVAVLHSGMTPNQRSYNWEQIRQGNADVVVGPRSAVFAPVPRLGLIIVDEEHENSYKQGTAPRYHGRDVAVKRAALEGVPVILGTATPSMESFNNAREGRYDLLTLPHRVRGLPMPALKVVNLRREMSPRRVELLGRTLSAKMAAALERGEQVILLMNRRGYASYVFCPSCKWMLECRHCAMPMVWHRSLELATCHHCGKTAALPDFCPACEGKILLFGYGIQRIEDELTRKFPHARFARMDSDTMTSPKQFKQVIGDFGDGELDILLGTQMVAKGLDFPNVSLVGVVSADTCLSINDFRASERTFQLIVQVAGRAGRGTVPGAVIVQTLYEDDPAVRHAVGHDYDGFSKTELHDRRDAGLPPFTRMVRFIIKDTDIERAADAADQFAAALRTYLPRDGVTFIGPQQAVLARIKDRFRFHLILISPRPGLIQDALNPRLPDLQKKIPADIIIDVDPVDLM